MGDLAEPELFGLVLSGGLSRRMGRDKASLLLPSAGKEHPLPPARRNAPEDADTVLADGENRQPQTWLARATELCAGGCDRVFVSIRQNQVGKAPFSDYPVIVDRYVHIGPAAGLLSAWDEFPRCAWLLLATDLPRLTVSTIATLVNQRDRNATATAFRHPDGTAEPLCTIWESAARDPLSRQVGGGNTSLREFLECSSTKFLRPPDPEAIVSVNTQQELDDWGSR